MFSKLLPKDTCGHLWVLCVWVNKTCQLLKRQNTPYPQYFLYPQLHSDPKYQHSLGELLLTKNVTIIVEATVFSLPRPPSPFSQMPTPPPIPEKQSIREAILHLFARYRDMRPLFLAAARPMKVEWKMSPYFGVLPLVFRALGEEYSADSLRSEISTLFVKASPPLPFALSLQSEPQAGLGLCPISCQPTAPRGKGKASNVADLETWSLCWALGITQTPGLAITPIAEACIGQEALVSHHCDPQTSRGHQKWHLSVGRCPHWYLNRAFSAPRICTVDAGYLARLVRLPA